VYENSGFTSCDRDECVYYSWKLYSRDLHYNYRKNGEEERQEAQTYNIKKCRKIGHSTVLWLKESFEAHGGGRSRITIFRHSFIPYRTKIHIAANSPGADAAGNKTRKKFPKKRSKRGLKMKDARTSPKRKTC